VAAETDPGFGVLLTAYRWRSEDFDHEGLAIDLHRGAVLLSRLSSLPFKLQTNPCMDPCHLSFN